MGVGRTVNSVNSLMTCMVFFFFILFNMSTSILDNISGNAWHMS